MDTVKLAGLRLVGFQTWEDLTISLHDGLNIINADNGVGKSVVLKALQFSLNPLKFSPRDRKDLIRTGCSESEIYYCFSNKVIFNIKFTPKDVFYYRAENSLDFQVVGNAPPSEMIGYFGSVIKGDIVSNIVSMDSSQLLVNSDYKDNSDLLSLLLNNDDLDRIIELSDKRFRQTKSKLKEINIELNALESQLASEPTYNIDVKVSNLTIAENLLVCLPLLMDISDDLEDLDDVGNSVYPIENYPGILSNLMDISNNLGSMDRSDLSDDLEDLFEVSKDVFEMADTLDSLSHYPDPSEALCILNSLDLLNEISYRFNDLTKLIPINKIDYLMNLIKGFSDNNEILSSVLNQGDLQSEIEDYEAEKDSLIDDGGEIVECPILGKVIYTQGDCIPIDN